jgi:DNA-binding winged helix-turn-helix (wHTH) protein
MSVIRFPPFVLDRSAATLVRGSEAVHLRPRTWDVLCYLVERPGLLVTKDDILEAVWSDSVVSEGTLTNSIRELRAALGDDARLPRYIETVHRRGFRFVADVVSLGGDGPAVLPGQAATGASPAPRAPGRNASPRFVARGAELESLLRAASEAAAGATRIVLLRGEAGIGKSSLVERFVATIAAGESLRGMQAAAGRTVGYLQGAPPYLPIVLAIEQLATGSDGTPVVEALRRHAPDLLQQMPWLSPETQSGEAGNESRRRDLAVRLGAFLTEITTRSPLALVLEDLHDADAPTIDFLVSLMEGSATRRILVVATYRPAEALLAGNGLAAAAERLAASDGCTAIDLKLLEQAEVAEYLRTRDSSFWTDALVASVHRRSGGNPLFMVTVADTVELVGGAADACEVPDSLRGLLETQLRSLRFAQRELLMAASAVGVEFSSQALAAATGRAIDEIEDSCEELARHGRFLTATGVADWPSGSVGQTYAFRHDLYRHALYTTLPAARRRILHQRIGEAIERGFAGATMEVAPQLADHFCQSGDVGRATLYLREAARIARVRSACREALELLDRALDLCAGLSGDNEREQTEFAIQAERAVAAGTLHGYGSALSREACERVAALGARLPASADRFFSLLVVFGYQIIRADLPAATALAEQMARMADQLQVPLLQRGALSVSSMAASARGDFEAADRGLRTFVSEFPREYRVSNFRDVLCPSLAVMAQNLCYLDRRREAERMASEAVERSDLLADEFERANCRLTSATVAALYGDRAQALHWARDVARISLEHEIDETATVAEIFLAWADGSASLETRRARAAAGLRGLEVSGRLLNKSLYLELLAQLEIEAGDFAAASSTLATARDFCRTTGAHRHLAEIWRRSAFVESKLGPRGGPLRARDWLEEAERVARRQGCTLVLRRLRKDAGGRAQVAAGRTQLP